MEARPKLVCKWQQFENGLVAFYFPIRLNPVFIAGSTFPAALVAWKRRLGLDGQNIQHKSRKSWVLLPEWEVDLNEAGEVLRQEFAERGIELEIRVYHHNREAHIDESELS